MLEPAGAPETHRRAPKGLVAGVFPGVGKAPFHPELALNLVPPTARDTKASDTVFDGEEEPKLHTVYEAQLANEQQRTA